MSGPEALETTDGEERVRTISELAREFGVTTRTIRFYEDRGLLSPGRRGRTRLYPPRERTRLRLILRGKRLGFSLSEIGEIVDLYDAEPGEAGQLHYLVGRIDERRAALERQRADIDETLADLDTVETRCRGRLDEIVRRGG